MGAELTRKELDKLDVGSRGEWRAWLRDHCDSSGGVWLVFYKDRGAPFPMSYGDAVGEALCFGWIDSIIKRLDERRYARKFTPRKPDSRWSTSNRLRYADLKKRGLLEKPGLERAPTGRSGDAPRPSLSAIPPYLEEALDAKPRARKFFDGLAPSYRRMCVAWVEAAKREETRQRRLREVVALLDAGKKLGMK